MALLGPFIVFGIIPFVVSKVFDWYGFGGFLILLWVCLLLGSVWQVFKKGF